MSLIKGIPAYWKKFLHQVLAMVKQLGTPTPTFSCADLRQNELISIIYKLNGVDRTDEEIDRVSYHERCGTWNKHPVLVVRHCQFSVEIFFKVIILGELLEKTQHYETGAEL